MKRATRAILAAALATGLAGTFLTPAAAGAPMEELDLRKLDRGASAAIPYLEGDVIVDGAVRVEGPRDVGGLLGESGGDYLVWAFSDGKDRVIRISADGSRELVLRARTLYDATLSPDGTTIATSFVGSSRRTILKTYDTTTGARTGRRTLSGHGSVLDLDGERVAVGVDNPGRTVVWTLATNRITKVAGDVGYRADLGADRLAVLTKDPYRGGCTVVSTFSDPETQLWRSCRERIEAWSTEGTRMATVDLLADGLGPGRMWLRKTGGRTLGAYDSPYYFGRIVFEDATHVLMDTYSDSLYAVVRCDGKTCERASRRYPHSTPVLAGRVPEPLAGASVPGGPERGPDQRHL